MDVIILLFLLYLVINVNSFFMLLLLSCFNFHTKRSLHDAAWWCKTHFGVYGFERFHINCNNSSDRVDSAIERDDVFVSRVIFYYRHIIVLTTITECVGNATRKSILFCRGNASVKSLLSLAVQESEKAPIGTCGVRALLVRRVSYITLLTL